MNIEQESAPMLHLLCSVINEECEASRNLWCEPQESIA